MVTKTTVNHFRFEQTAKSQFVVSDVRKEIVPFVQDSNVYVTEIGTKRLLICNLPQSYADFKLDKQIYIYHADLAR